MTLAILSAFVAGAPTCCSAQESEIDWAADIRLLQRELPNKHVNFFAHLDKDNFNSAATKLIKQSSSLSDGQMQIELMRLIAMAKDGHSGIRADFSKLHYFPFNARWFDDGITVVNADIQHKDLVGAKLIGVAGVKMEKVVEQLALILAHDNLAGLKSRMDQQLNTAELLQAATGAKSIDSIEFEFEKDGMTFKRELKSVKQKNAGRIKWSFRMRTIPRYMKKSQLNFWNDWIADSKIVYFKYNRCQDLKGFANLVNQTAAFIEQNPVEKIVIDLRHNGGGNSAIFKPMLKYLREHPTLNQKGKLFVIIGRRTYSSAMWNTLDLKSKTKAILVGESIGGKPNHFGEVRTFTLPSSKLTVYYSTRHWVLSKDSDPDTVKPDLPVKFLAKDYFEGKDPYLQAIIDYKK